MQPQFDRINAEVREHRYENAIADLEAVMASPRFEELPAEMRHWILSVAGSIDVELHRPAEARPLFARARQMPEATANDWFGEADVARAQHDDRGVIVALTEAGRRWPEALLALKPDLVDAAAHRAEKLHDLEARIEFLEVLFDARWKPSAVEPSALWKRLALLELQRNRPEAAALLVSRITSPHQIIAVRADFRFDVLVRADPDRFDVHKAQESELEQLRDAVKTRPRSLEAILWLAQGLAGAGRYREVLEVTGDAAAGGAAAPGFDDAGKFMNWLLNERAYASKALGAWDDAVAEMEKASRLEEGGSKNVSQAINLAAMYVAVGRPKDALLALDGVVDLSPYGRMQVESVRQRAALEMGDAAAAAKALSFMSEHRDDAIETCENGFLRANKLDEAAAVLISRLADPDRRSDALLEVQHYAPTKLTPRETQWSRRWTEFVARPEVQAAIARVGRVERYDIPRRGD